MNPTTSAPPFSIDLPARSWLSVRIMRWLWRHLLLRPLRWFRRHFWKICVWTITLVTLVWQYENWHGRTALAEQQALWTAEFGEMKSATAREVPDDQNFFAAPVFAKMSQPQDTLDSAYNNAISEMPHRKFLRLQFPEINLAEGLTVEQSFVQLPPADSIPVDISAWAAAQINAGKPRPEGLSDAAWLHASMPQDETIAGLVDALRRPESLFLPNLAERMEVADKMGSIASQPIMAWSGGFALVKSLILRARVASLAGDGQRALELTEVCLRFAEAGVDVDSLVTMLVSTATEGETLSHLGEILAARSMTDAQLGRLASRLSLIDEEKSTRGALMAESQRFQNIKVKDFRSAVRYVTFPTGWIDANKANALKWWQHFMSPDVPGDDLVYFAKKMERGIPLARAEYSKFPTPRTVFAMIAIPALDNVVKCALENQTLRRQLLAAIGMERSYLRHGHYPETLSALVPEFLPAIPGDPWKPGTPLQLKRSEDGGHYQIISAGKAQPLRL